MMIIIIITIIKGNYDSTRSITDYITINADIASLRRVQKEKRALKKKIHLKKIGPSVRYFKEVLEP